MKYIDPLNDQVYVTSDVDDPEYVKNTGMKNFQFFVPEDIDCGKGHGFTLCCLEANFIRMVLKFKDDYDYVYFIDDDVYLWPPALRNMLRDYASRPELAGKNLMMPIQQTQET